MIKKYDLWLIFALLISALMIYSGWSLSNKAGSIVVVTVEGEEYARLPLDTDTRLKITVEDGYNLLVIEDKKAYLLDADCPDRLCVKMGSIEKSGQSIICLPHKVVVEIEGGEDPSDMDVMVR